MEACREESQDVVKVSRKLSDAVSLIEMSKNVMRSHGRYVRDIDRAAAIAQKALMYSAEYGSYKIVPNNLLLMKSPSVMLEEAVEIAEPVLKQIGSKKLRYVNVMKLRRAAKRFHRGIDRLKALMECMDWQKVF